MLDENNKVNYSEDQNDIDIIALVQRLWSKKKFILIVTGCFMLLGTIVALMSPDMYTSSITFVPQTSKKNASGGISSIAAMAGVNLNDMSYSQTLSPSMYPQILDNFDFKKDLMYSRVKFEQWDEPITLIDYYSKYKKKSVVSIIKKYTIGLPKVIVKAIKKKKNSSSIAVETNNDNLIRSYSSQEYSCAGQLGQVVTMSLDEKRGYITITTNMEEPYASAQLCQLSFDLLCRYIIEFKIDKARTQKDFIESRYYEKKSEYEEKQQALATFQDANRILSSAKARTELERLSSEYNLSKSIYTEMATQLLKADIQVKEDTPVLTVVKPVVVPYKKSQPDRSMIFIAWTFIGFILACGCIVGVDFLKGRGINLPNKLEFLV